MSKNARIDDNADEAVACMELYCSKALKGSFAYPRSSDNEMPRKHNIVFGLGTVLD